ncbi:MAG: Fic family protein, partial [Bacteroidales bacterium]|nr:Fic family protein [Bacteroidales bacterium]
FDEIDKLQKEVIAIRPVLKAQLKELKNYYKIGLTYSSNALEGNSLTESETKVVLEDGITIGGKPLKDYYEAEGHAKAFDLVYKLAKKLEITEKNIKDLHKLFYQNINSQNAGKYRKVRVFISGSEFKPPVPEQIPELMKSFIEKYKTNKQNYHPVVFAAKLHKNFVFIHPFIDGNGRIARLLMNLIFIKYQYPVTIIPPVLRMEYINLLEKAHKDDNEFINFIAQRVKQAQLEYIRLLS